MVSSKILVVSNEGMLFLAAGCKVHGQTAGDCGGGPADINTILRCSHVTVRTNVLVYDVCFLQWVGRVQGH